MEVHFLCIAPCRLDSLIYQHVCAIRFWPCHRESLQIHIWNKRSFYFILLYVGGAALSVIPAYGRNKENPFYNAVGASGAISSVVFAIIIINPFASLSLIFLPISFPAVLFGMVYLVYSYIMARKGDGPIGHDTHFWGGIFGMAFTGALKPSLFISFANNIIQYFF